MMYFYAKSEVSLSINSKVTARTDQTHKTLRKHYLYRGKDAK